MREFGQGRGEIMWLYYNLKNEKLKGKRILLRI